MKKDKFGIYSNVSKSFVARSAPKEACPRCGEPMLVGQTLAKTSRTGFGAGAERALEHLACAKPATFSISERAAAERAAAAASAAAAAATGAISGTSSDQKEA